MTWIILGFLGMIWNSWDGVGQWHPVLIRSSARPRVAGRYGDEGPVR